MIGESVLEVQGGKPLRGEYRVSGSKNAALPLLAAAISVPRISTIKNVPRIADIERFLSIAHGLGVESQWIEKTTLKIDARALKTDGLLGEEFQESVGSMRASILLLAPLILRCGQAKMPIPGGCVLGKRPVEAHLWVMRQYGARDESTSYSLNFFVQEKGENERTIVLPEVSVTATENALILSALTPGVTHIRLAASEPHVQNLCSYLESLGARIEGVGSHSLKVYGISPEDVSEEPVTEVYPDYLEAGTAVIAGVMTQGRLKVSPVRIEDLDALWQKLYEIGADIELQPLEKAVLVRPHEKPLKATRIQTGVFPQFPTDLHPQFAALMTLCEGNSRVFETLFERKFAYLFELEKLGAKVELHSPREFTLTGAVKLTGASVSSQDIRAGAAVLLAALCAEGASTIHNVRYIDRGYADIEEKLRQCGASIERRLLN